MFGVVIGAVMVICFYSPFPSIGKMGIQTHLFPRPCRRFGGICSTTGILQGAQDRGNIGIIPITSCYPLFTFLLGWMFLGEDVTLSKVIGMLLILGGIFLLK